MSGRLRPGLAACALLAVSGVASAAAPLLETSAAWDGWTRPDRVVEARLRVRSDRAGPVDITLAGFGQEVTTTLDVNADTPVRTSIPVLAARTDVAIRARFPGGATLDANLSVNRAERPLIAWATASGPGDEVSNELGRQYKLLTVTPGALPERAAAYSSVDALVLDTQAVLALKDQQLAAFLDHLGACGRVVLIGASEDLLAAARNASGCASGALARAATAREAAAHIREYEAIITPTSIPLAQIAALRGPDRHWPWVAGLIIAGLIIIAIGATATNSTRRLIAIVLAISVTVPVLVRLTTPRSDIVVWAESSPGGHQANYSALELIHSARAGVLEGKVPTLLAQPDDCGRGRVDRWIWDAQAGRFRTARIRASLFGPALLCFRGNFPIAQSARLARRRDGTIEVTNLGAVAWPGARLVIGQQVSSLPQLESGHSVGVTLNGHGSEDPAARLAVTRIAPHTGAVLLPLDLGALGIEEAREEGWLMLHAPVLDLDSGET